MKRAFKVISAVEHKDGGTHWLRLGTAYVNKDESINVYLDAWPKSFQLQLRELTEEDFARRTPRTSEPTHAAPPPRDAERGADHLPF